MKITLNTMKVVAIALALSGSILTSCSDEKDWIGTVYPDKDNLTKSVRIGFFPDVFSCRNSANELRMFFTSPEKFDYECATGCRSEPGYDFLICERVER